MLLSTADQIGHASGWHSGALHQGVSRHTSAGFCKSARRLQAGIRYCVACLPVLESPVHLCCPKAMLGGKGLMPRQARIVVKHLSTDLED